MKKLLKNPLTILVAGIALLVLSGVGSTRAAINEVSDDIKFSFKTAEVGVEILENGNSLDHEDGVLLDRFGEKSDEEFHIGQDYEEVIAIKNVSENYDCYARVVLNRSWATADGITDCTLDPTLIEFNIPATATIVNPDGSTASANWIIEESATKEQLVCYLDRPLPVGATVELTKSIRVNDAVTTDASNSETSGVVTTTYNYANRLLKVSAKAQGVQTHNANDALWAAWGIKTDLSDENMVIGSIENGNGTRIEGLEPGQEQQTHEETGEGEGGQQGQVNEPGEGGQQGQVNEPGEGGQQGQIIEPGNSGQHTGEED